MGGVEYRWKGPFESGAVEALHAEGFGHDPVDYDWRRQVVEHSLGWVCAYRDGRLVGFVNVAWDGAGHAFVLDTLVSANQQRAGIGTQLVQEAIVGARAAGCEWLHVDFDSHLEAFYVEGCGFLPTRAGLIALQA
ncbi:MAG: GNAT family N-acetyltransferase [Acidimicrobiia bacterium]|nr:GNAT family N-acetyltransferase [Acidimicrobiia bacterium]